MTRLKMFLINVILSALVGVLMQVVWAIFAGFDKLTLTGIVNMAITGVIVGTVSLFALFQVALKFNSNLKKAILVNSIIMMLLNVAFYFESGILNNYWKIDGKWLVVVMIGEAAVVALTVLWYKQLAFYSKKLELKKASLCQGDGSSDT